MAGRKSALVVEDDKNALDSSMDLLKVSGYKPEGVFYEGSQTNLPSKKFYAVISDGLDGGWRRVFDETTAKKKILFSGDSDYTEQASSAGFISVSKFDGLAKVLEELE